MRESGYYWVRIDEEGYGQWLIAEWNESQKEWYIAGIDGDYGGYKDTYFDFIDENRLVRSNP